METKFMYLFTNNWSAIQNSENDWVLRDFDKNILWIASDLNDIITEYYLVVDKRVVVK